MVVSTGFVRKTYNIHSIHRRFYDLSSRALEREFKAFVPALVRDGEGGGGGASH